MMLSSVAVLTIFGRVLSLGVAVLALRVSTADGAADVLFALSLANLMAPLLNWGSLQAPVAARSESAEAGNTAAHSAITISIALLGATCVCALSLVAVGFSSVGWFTLFIGSFGARLGATGAIRSGPHLVLGTAVRHIVFPLIAATALGVVWLLGREPMEPSNVMLLTGLAGLSSAVISVGASVCIVDGRPKWQLPSRAYIGLGSSFVVVGFGSLSSNHIVGVVGRWLVDSAEYTVLAMAIRMAAVLVLPLDILTNVIPTEIARANASGMLRSLESRLRRVATAALVVSTMAVGPVALMYVVTLPSDRRGGVAWLVFAIVVVAQLVKVATGNCSLLLSFSGHQDVVARVVWLSAAVGLAAGLILGAIWGVLGLALAQAMMIGWANWRQLVLGRIYEGIDTKASASEIGWAIRRLSRPTRLGHNVE